MGLGKTDAICRRMRADGLVDGGGRHRVVTDLGDRGAVGLGPLPVIAVATRLLGLLVWGVASAGHIRFPHRDDGADLPGDRVRRGHELVMLLRRQVARQLRIQRVPEFRGVVEIRVHADHGGVDAAEVRHRQVHHLLDQFAENRQPVKGFQRLEVLGDVSFRTPDRTGQVGGVLTPVADVRLDGACGFLAGPPFAVFTAAGNEAGLRQWVVPCADGVIGFCGGWSVVVFQRWCSHVHNSPEMIACTFDFHAKTST